jgi:hypothetical protein
VRHCSLNHASTSFSAAATYRHHCRWQLAAMRCRPRHHSLLRTAFVRPGVPGALARDYFLRRMSGMVQVVVGTNTSIGEIRDVCSIKHVSFPIVLMDEAGQARETRRSGYCELLHA